MPIPVVDSKGLTTGCILNDLSTPKGEERASVACQNGSVPEWPRETRASWQEARANFVQAGLVNVLHFVRART